MPDSRHPDRFYVYILYREDGVTPFYVGKGSGRRWLAHEMRCAPGRSHKDNIITAMKARGVSVPKTKVAEGLTQLEAGAVEVSLIAEIGREPLGPLVNRTAGGDGCSDPSQETRQKRSAALRRRSPKIREGIAQKLAGNKHALGNTHKLSAETRQNMSTAQRGRTKSPEHRQKMAEASRRWWADDENRRRAAESGNACMKRQRKGQ